MEKNKVRILIVDDEQDILDAIQTHLQLEGYAVDVAASADQAINLFKQEPYHIVLSDINMPHKDGLAFLEEVKAERGDTMVIMITAYTTLTKVLMSRLHGAFDYVLKPFRDLSELTETVDRCYKTVDRWNRVLQETRKIKKEQAS